MDVSTNVAIGSVLIYKLYREFTGINFIDAKGESIEDEDFVRERPEETDLVAEMLAIVAPADPGTSLIKTFKAAAKVTNLSLYLEKVEGAFRAYEQDLRDGVEDVQLALSAYRLRVDAENSLYLALQEPDTSKELGKITVSRQVADKVEVNALPSYADLAEAEASKRAEKEADQARDARIRSELHSAAAGLKSELRRQRRTGETRRPGRWS